MNIRFSGVHRAWLAWLLAAGVPMLPPPSTLAATLPSGYTETRYASGISQAVAMEFAPDGRLFVCEQSGRLRVIKGGVLLPAPFVTLDVDDTVERGLLGIAFDSGFAANHYLYVYYTAKLPKVHNRVSRFTAAGDLAVPGSETVLLELDNLSAGNHNGGAIHFGVDGKLYIGAGENGDGANAQTLTNLLGKLLRINSDGSIPADNPFYGSATGRNRAIWALGFRNPFTFAVQPGSGRMFVNDVGNRSREEIDELARGGNYGWPDCEGACAPANSSFRDPIYFYLHGGGNRKGNCIAGGTFYNPPTNQFPATEVGAYYFSDYKNGWIGKLPPNNRQQAADFAAGISSPVDLKTGPDGRLYYLSRGDGTVMAIHWTHSWAGSAGSYQGLFYETNRGVRHGASGFFSLVLRSGGAYSGRLQQGTTRHAFTGTFDADGKATNTVERPGTNAITAELILERNSQITGRISDGSWRAVLIADRAVFDARTNPATNFANHYTLLVPASADVSSEPAGDGAGSVIVNNSGGVRLTGVLADGSPMAQKVPLSTNGAWPLYVSLYGGRGSALGWILITNSTQPDLGGLVSWSRPPGPRPKVHTNGFALDSMLIGSAYRAPGTNTIFGETSAVVILSQGGLGESITNNVTLASSARVTYAGTNKLTLKLTQKSGAFAGKITPPGTRSATAFKGAILQKQGYGGGFFLDTDQSGRVEFRPRATSSGAAGPLVRLAANPRYFTDGSGRAVYLTGSHTWGNNKDYGVSDPPPPFDYTAYLDFLQRMNHNFFRLWTWELPHSEQAHLAQMWRRLPFPWLRTGPGLANDGKPAFNLEQFNQPFFDRLRARVIEAGNRGMYVAVMLWDGIGIQDNSHVNDGFPFKAGNNVNGISCSGIDSQSLVNAAVTARQEAYARKVIDSLNDLDNVLYEIVNEAGSYSTAWQYHMISFIKNYQATKPKQHPVGMTYQYSGGTDSTLYHSAAEWISPVEAYPISDGTKVVISDTDHAYYWTGLVADGQAAHQNWVWRNFLGGNNTLFMDPYLVVWPGRNAPSGTKTDPYWDVMRKNLGYTKLYADKVNLAAMMPSNGLVSNGACLANRGTEYLVYSRSGSFTLTVVPGSYRYEWLNLATGQVATTGNINISGSSQTFSSPTGGAAVLYLKNSSTP